MVVDVVMPRLSDSMEEGVILKWIKSAGDAVERGEDLVEVETDKANMTYASDTTGVLVKVLAEEGAVLPVGEVIARIETDGDASSSKDAAPSKSEPATDKAATDRTTTELQDEGRVDEDREPATDAQAGGTQAPSEKVPGTAGARIKASPIARRLASEAGLDLRQIEGSGPGSRIVRADVESASRSTESQEVGKPAPVGDEQIVKAGTPAPGIVSTDESPSKGQVEIVEPTRLQQTVARRMSESKATVPHFNLQLEVDMADAVKLRGELKDLAGDQQVPSYNDMVIKASALALREHPRVNGAYRDGRFEFYSRVNVGVAVASKEALIVPTVVDADQKSLGEIAKEARGLAERVRSGQITPPELSGGTFTVSNLGMYGIDSFSAVINPPQAAILAVGAVTRKPVVNSSTGLIEPKEMMNLTLCCDHRILYGAEGAEFLGRVREILQEPSALTL